jgi:hypothetical protein
MWFAFFFPGNSRQQNVEKDCYAYDVFIGGFGWAVSLSKLTPGGGKTLWAGRARLHFYYIKNNPMRARGRAA